jgi:hypothetical protein
MLTSGGLDPDDVRTAFRIASETMDSELLSRYSRSVVIGDGGLPDAALESIDLSSLPDGFNEQEATVLGMATIALAFGVDARELWPMTGVGATRADALVQHLKAQQKGIGNLLAITEKAVGRKVLPDTLDLIFDYQDDAQDRQVAEIRKIRSERHEIDIKNLLLDERTAREQMLESGDITQAQFERLELKDGRLEDGTSILQLFHADEFQRMLNLGIPDPLDTDLNDVELMRPLIAEKRAELIQGLGKLTNFRSRREIHMALEALNALESEYEKGQMADLRDEQPDEETEGEESDDASEAEGGISTPTEDEVELSSEGAE